MALNAIAYPAAAYALGMFQTQGCVGAFLGISVFLMDNGFTEADLALVYVVALLPAPFKFLMAAIIDRPKPPWTGGLLRPAGRRRPVILYAMLLAALGLVGFGLVNGREPTLANIALLGFPVALGATLAQVGIDGHATELLAEEPPEYLAESQMRFSGRIAAQRALAQNIGSTLASLWVTQVGPAWSWTGAFVIWAGFMLLLCLVVVPLKDVVHAMPLGGERLSCRVICDWFRARGEHGELYLFLNKTYFCFFMAAFGGFGTIFLCVPYFKRQFDIAQQDQGYIQLLVTVGITVGVVAGGFAADAIGSRRVFLVSSTWTCLGPICVLLAGKVSLALSYVAVASIGLIFGPIVGTCQAVIYSNMAPSAPATSFSMAMTAANAGALLSASLLVVASASYDLAFGFAAAILVFSSVLIVCLFHSEPRAEIDMVKRNSLRTSRRCSEIDAAAMAAAAAADAQAATVVGAAGSA